jgi:hypothetical protein
MVQRVATVAFEDIEARAVDVQVQVAPGLPAFKLVGCQCELGPRSHDMLGCTFFDFRARSPGPRLSYARW